MTESNNNRQKWKTQIVEEDDDPFQQTKKVSLLNQNLDPPRSVSVKPETEKDDSNKSPLHKSGTSTKLSMMFNTVIDTQQKKTEVKPQKQAQVKEEVNVYTDPKEIERQWHELHEEYMRENEKEVPANSSKIIFQCLHPLQDTVQDAFSHLIHDRQDNLSTLAGNSDTKWRQQLNQEQHQTASYAYEYLLILEQLTQASFSFSQDNHQRKKSGFLSGIGHLGPNKKESNTIVNDDDFASFYDKTTFVKTSNMFENSLKIDNMFQAPPQRFKLVPDNFSQDKKLGSIQTSIHEQQPKFVNNSQQNVPNFSEKKNNENLNTFISQTEEEEKSSAAFFNFKNTAKKDKKIHGYKTELYLEKIKNGATNKTTSPSDLFTKENIVDYNYRQWIYGQEECLTNSNTQQNALPNDIGLINNEDDEDSKEEVQSVSGPSPFNAQSQVQMQKLRMQIDQSTTQQCKQYRLSMWRLDKEKLTKLNVAEQTITVQKPDLELLKNKFCFSIDKNIIHMTFKDSVSDQIRKTISFNSIDLSQVHKHEFNYVVGNMKGTNLICDPVMYEDTDGQLEEDDDFKNHDKSSALIIENIRETRNVAKSYFVYFQDQNKGYFCYKNQSRNTDFSLVTQTVDPDTELRQIETIKHVFFGMNDEKDNFIVLSQVEQLSGIGQLGQENRKNEDRQMVKFFKVEIVNMYKMILQSNKQIKELMGASHSNQGITRQTYITMDQSIYKGMTINRAMFHRRHGIIMEIALAEALINPLIMPQQPADSDLANEKTLILISSSMISKNLKSVEPKIFKISNLKIPLNAQYQSKLCMKVTFKQNDYLFFFEDLVGSKGSMELLFENKQLIKVAPSRQQADGYSSLINIPQQFCDFIVSTEKKMNVNEVTITDVDISTTEEFQSKPLITFITHNYLAVQDQLIMERDNNQVQMNAQTVQQQLSFATKQQTLMLDTQHLYYNEPYIFSVDNQITLNIYHTMEPSKNYTYQLLNHFECFLDLQELEFCLPEGAIPQVRKLYRHQICAMLTFDLIERCHRVEIFVAPSYHQMSEEVFQMITMPYKLDLNIAPGSLQNILITGHLHQLREYKLHKHHGQTQTEEKMIDSLILQFFDSVVQIDLNKQGHPRKLLLEMDAVPVMENRAANLKMIRIDQSGKLLKELMIKTQALQRKDALLPQSKLRERFGDRRYYLVLQPGYNYGAYSSSTHIWLLEHSCQEFELEKQVVYEFTSNLGQQPSEILQMSLSNNDQDGLTLLTLDRQFVVKKFRIKVKTNQVQLRIVDETIPNEEAEKLWSDLLIQDQKLQMPVLSYNFRNLNPREIIITNNGIYMESMFFQNIFKSNAKLESMLEFESKRDKDVSKKLHNNPSMDFAVELNISGGFQSTEMNSILYYYRKLKTKQVSAPQKANTSNRPVSKNLRMSKQISFRSNENLNFGNKITEDESVIGFFFLSIPLVTSKIKQIMPLDTLSQQQVEYSTFLGTENDDILVKLKSTEDSHGILIFGANGQQRQVQVSKPDNLYPVMANFKVQQFLNCPSKIQNQASYSRIRSKLTASFKDQIEIKPEQNQNQPVLGDESNNSELIQKILLVNKQFGQYSILGIHRFQNIYTLSLQSDQPWYISPIHNLRPQSVNQVKESVISILKLQYNPNDRDANLVRFIFDNKYHNKAQSISGRTHSDTGSRSGSSFMMLGQSKGHQQIFNTLFLDIDNGRQKVLEDQLLEEVIQKDIQENPQLVKQTLQRTNTLSNIKQSLFLKKKPQISTDIDSEALIVSQQESEISYTNDDFDIFIFPRNEKDVEKSKSFFVFRCRNKLWYAKVEKSIDTNGNELKIHNGIKKINVQFREPGFITQILQVQRQDYIQIMYSERYTGNFYLFLWDLTNNQEISMQTFKTNQQNPFFQVFKGANTRENFLIHIGSEYIQDLRLELPQNYLSGKKAWSGIDLSPFTQTLAKTEPENFDKNLLQHYREYKDELKISHSCTKALGLNSFGKTQVQRTYSYLDLQYIQYLFQRFFSPKAMREDTRKPLLFEQLNVQMPFESNLMHYFATNQLFLELYLQEITSKMQYNEEKNQNDMNLTYAYYALMPNSLPIDQTRGKGRRPFSIALKSNQGACFELIIQVLSIDTKRCYSRDIKQYLQTLLVLKSEVVREFLSHHTSRYLFHQHVSSHLVDSYLKNSWGKVLKMTLMCRDTTFLQFTPSITQYLNDDDRFLMLKSKNKKPAMANKSKKVQDQFALNESQAGRVEMMSKWRVNDTYSDDENDSKILQSLSGKQAQFLKIKSAEDKKQIQFNSFDFEGLLYGYKAEEFLKFIINQTNNLGIFELKYIQRLIDFQWQRTSRRYYFVIFLYSLKIIMMMGYIISQQALINCQIETTGDKSFGCSQTIFEKLKYSQWDYFNDIFISILLPMQFFITLYEVKRYERMDGAQGLMIILFNILHLLKLITDILLLFLFRIWFLRYNLQSEYLDEDYWHITDLDTYQSVDKEYLMRAAGSWIFIIKGGNAFLMISLPLILLYKWRFHPFISVYIPRFFLVLSSLAQLLIFFVLLTMMLQYSQKILSVLNYSTPSNNADKLNVGEGIKDYVDWIGFLNTLYRESMLIGINAVLVCIVLYGAAVIIKADVQASRNFQAQKYINLAKLIYEGGLLRNGAKRFVGARYIIESYVEKGNDTFLTENEMAMTQSSEMNDNQQVALLGSRKGVSMKSADLKSSGDALNVSQLKELLIKERQHNEQQLNDIKTALANLEKRLVPQEADPFDNKKK